MDVALTRIEDLERTPQWSGWQTLAADRAPYLAPEFFAMSRSFVEHGEPLVATATAGGTLIGALPLILDRHTLRGLRTDYTPGYDFAGTKEGITAIWKALADDGRWSELVLDKVPSRSLLAMELPVLARLDGCPVDVRSDGRHPYFELEGWQAALKPKFRSNLQRCERKAGNLVLERVLDPSDTDLADALAIEAMAWKGAAGTSIATDPRASNLYTQMLRQPGHRASLFFLRANGKRIATLFACEDAHTLYALKIGYDPAFANISPGHLLVWKVAADAESRGLRELDFVGREDEWKRKWTDRVHDRMIVVIYRRSARGLARYAMREVIKPWLPHQWITTPQSPLPRHCQRADLLAAHSISRRAVLRVERGFGIRGALARRTKPPRRVGEASKFPVGTFVRVRDRLEIDATLDGNDKLRGLAFVEAQWRTCGGVFEVVRHVRRLRNDRGRYRAIDRTVLLAGIDCGATGAHDGCGRRCPLMFRDEWLEPTSPRASAEPSASVHYARIRDLDEIYAGLDLSGRRDGLTFMPEMAKLAGQRFAIADTLREVYEDDRWRKPRAAIYMLDRALCTGAICGSQGPCDRACMLLWHADWLVVE
ncbi:MAG: GNAT family N-acetyltransferase [Kofleriaceae bacterium]